MDLSKKTSTNGPAHSLSSANNSEEAAAEFMSESKKKVNDLYEHTIDKLGEAQAVVKDYSHKVVDKVYEYPFTSILIVGGVSFLIGGLSLIAHLARKKQ